MPVLTASRYFGKPCLSAVRRVIATPTSKLRGVPGPPRLNEHFLQQLINGISLGAILWLIALGYTMLRILRLINLHTET
jgi:hypothetical protein